VFGFHSRFGGFSGSQKKKSEQPTQLGIRVWFSCSLWRRPPLARDLAIATVLSGRFNLHKRTDANSSVSSILRECTSAFIVKESQWARARDGSRTHTREYYTWEGWEWWCDRGETSRKGEEATEITSYPHQHRIRGLADTSSDKRVSRDLGTQWWQTYWTTAGHSRNMGQCTC
jgi:hypothetical protein